MHCSKLAVNGLGQIGRGVGELIVSVLAQVADIERARINERTESGRTLAQATLAATGRTHKGKTSTGRKAIADAAEIKAKRKEENWSIAQTAKHLELSESTVKRYCAV